MSIEPILLSPGPAVREALDRLRAMLDGDGPLLLPHADDEQVPLGPVDGASVDRIVPEGGPVGVPEEGPDGRWPAGIAVGTSGSTGRPKRAVLPTAALRASAEATHAVLGGPGRWLLTLPPHHIAGLQVVLRSLAAGVEPAWATSGPFTAAGFVADVRATARAGTPCRYVSLVPTQLTRLLADADAARALAGFDAVLVGGAATGSDLLARARDRGVRVVTTYGMSETAGGCVYDGRALPGVRVEVRPKDADPTDLAPGHSPARTAAGQAGRIHLGGPVVALGYLPDGRERGPGERPFTQVDGVRWFRTDDLGALRTGALDVLGRVDDVIVTGGLKVAPVVVEEALASARPGVEGVAFGVPDAQWGQVVALALAAPIDTHERLRAQWPRLVEDLRSALPGHALPRRLVTVAELPLRGPGKPDRAALRALAAGCENGRPAGGGASC